eukprot:1673387-Pleurochrysis_carterae.AAC.1
MSQRVYDHSVWARQPVWPTHPACACSVRALHMLALVYVCILTFAEKYVPMRAFIVPSVPLYAQL